MVDTTPYCWSCGSKIPEGTQLVNASSEMAFPSLTVKRGAFLCSRCARLAVLEEVADYLSGADEPSGAPNELQLRVERVYRACWGKSP